MGMAPSSHIDQMLRDAAMGARSLSAEDLQQVTEHIARAGSDPTVYRGKNAADVHYEKHVVKLQEWPIDTTLAGYLRSFESVIRDPASGLFTSRYAGAYQFRVARKAGALRGPAGYAYLLVEYRLGLGR